MGVSPASNLLQQKFIPPWFYTLILPPLKDLKGSYPHPLIIMFPNICRCPSFSTLSPRSSFISWPMFTLSPRFALVPLLFPMLFRMFPFDFSTMSTRIFCNFPQVFPTHVSHISRIFHGFFMISNHFYAIFGPVPSPSSPHLRNVPAAELMQFDWDDWGIGNSPVPRVAWLGTGLFFGGKTIGSHGKTWEIWDVDGD